MVGETAGTSSLMFCFTSTVVPGFFSYTSLLRYPQRKKYCDYGHSFRWILKCRRNILWVKTESLFFLNRLHSKSPMLYRPALHGNWNALSLARRALKDKFPTPTVPLTAVLPNRQVFLPDPVAWRWASKYRLVTPCKLCLPPCSYHLRSDPTNSVEKLFP